MTLDEAVAYSLGLSVADLPAVAAKAD
jgi:hypothetical protein